MKKDKTIIIFLESIGELINFYHWEIVDYWDADLCSIGLKKSNRLIYISTFNFYNKASVKYDYNLELTTNSDVYQSVKEGRGVTVTELKNEMLLFLEKG